MKLWRKINKIHANDEYTVENTRMVNLRTFCPSEAPARPSARASPSERAERLRGATNACRAENIAALLGREGPTPGRLGEPLQSRRRAQKQRRRCARGLRARAVGWLFLVAMQLVARTRAPRACVTVVMAESFAGTLGIALLSSRRSRMAVATHGAISRSGGRMHSCTVTQTRNLSHVFGQVLRNGSSVMPEHDVMVLSMTSWPGIMCVM